jgi:hypothetical protein
MIVRNDPTQTTLSLVQQTYRHLNLQVPQALLDDLTAVDNATGQGPGRDGFDNLLGAILAAVAAGKDPAADKAVQTELFRRQLADGQILDALGRIASDKRAAVLRRHAPALVEVMRPTVEAADSQLAELREVIPPDALFRVDAVASLQPEHMAAWGRGRENLDRLRYVEAAWRVLAGALGMYDHPTRRPLALADLTAEQLAELGPKATAADVVRAGHPLSLATFDEYDERVARVTEQEADQQRRAAQPPKRQGFTNPLPLPAA